MSSAGALAAPARAAVLSGVQTGTAVSNANGTLTVPISAINPAQSILFFETSSDSDRPPGSTVRGTIASATTLTFIRVTDEVAPAPINIRWYVATFASGVERATRRGRSDAPRSIDVPIDSRSPRSITLS